jgi:hypothetical protein
MFDASVARDLGLELKEGRLGSAQGIGGSAKVWVHEVCIHLPDGDPVTTLAAFKEDLPAAGLLGIAGFFQHFIVTFNPLGQCLSSSASRSATWRQRQRAYTSELPGSSQDLALPTHIGARCARPMRWCDLTREHTSQRRWCNSSRSFAASRSINARRFTS